MYICQYCGKECKSLNSLRNHERCCPKNPNRNYKNGMLGKTAWNKGLTAENCEDIKKQKETYQKNKKLGIHKMSHRKHTAEEKELFRQNAFKNKLGGFNMHKVKLIVDGIPVDSSYEEVLAKDLSLNNIKWKRAKRFKYHDLNKKLHYYTPDFYLPDYNIYLDPKNDYLIKNVNPILGYKDIDKINWVMKENNVRILVLSKEQLNWNYIKENI